MPLRFERPSDLYMRELKAVERSALTLRDYMRGVNSLPNDFPQYRILFQCDALILLPHGTAEGSIVSLITAEAELKHIQQFHIPLPPELDEPPSDDLMSLIERDGDLDNRISAVVKTVGLAIECYRRESGDAIETEIAPEPTAGPDLAEELVNVSDNATNTGKLAKSAQETLTDIKVAHSTKAENVDRILTDIQAETNAAKGVLINLQPRPTVLEKLGTGMDKTASALEQSGKLLELGADIATTANNTYHELQRQIVDSIPTAMRTIAKGFKLIAKSIRKFRENGNKGRLQVPAADFSYVEVYNRLLRGEAIPESWVPLVTELDFSFYEPHHLQEAERDQIVGDPSLFSNTDLLATYTNLKNLSLANTPVSDLIPLADLTNLTSLSLANTQVFELTPLSACTNLMSLFLDNTKIDNIAPLSTLAKLTRIWLDNTEVSDIASLSTLKNLTTLWLSGTQVHDLGPLSTLKNLKTLILDKTKVADLTPLSSLKNLDELHLDKTLISDVTPLAGLTSLTYLSLDDTKVTSIAPLAAIEGLESLWLRNTKISDYTPLSHLKKLKIRT